MAVSCKFLSPRIAALRGDVARSRTRARGVLPAALHPAIAALPLAAALISIAAATPFEEGNEAFAKGNHAEAARLYAQAIATDGYSAARLLNLGRAQAAMGRQGEAILSFERAAWLAPRNAAVRASLTKARGEARLARPEAASPASPDPAWWEVPVRWLSPHEWSRLTGVALAIATVLLILRLFPRLLPRPWMKPAATAASAAGFLAAATGTAALGLRHAEMRLAILTGAEPVLRLSPFETAAPVAGAPPATGSRVLPLGSRSGWRYVSLTGTDTAGWVPESAMTLLVPPGT